MLSTATAHPIKNDNTALSIPDTKSYNPYIEERLRLIKPKPEIMPTDLDIQFMLAMELNQGVHACFQYLRGFSHVPNHSEVIMLPATYSKHISDFITNQTVRSGVYFTPNGFKHHSTKKAEFLTVKSAFLDIDFAKDKIMSVNKRIDLTKLVLIEANLPYPTAIIDSGHGLHLYYIFKDEVYDNTSNKIFSRMLERIHHEFIQRFNHAIPKVTDQTFEADPAAANANRNLRLPVSWNATIPVHCVEFRKDHFVDFDYLFDDFMPEYDQLKVKRAKAARKKGTPKKIKRINSINALNVQRVADLLTLLKLRQYDLPGIRNEYLHILACQYHLHALDNWEPEVYRTNSLLVDPLPDREVKGIIKSAKRGSYTYKNKTIINKLSITSAELKHMNMNEMTAREARETQRQNQRYKKKERNQQILHLFKKGMSKAAIAREVGASRPTVHKIIKEQQIQG